MELLKKSEFQQFVIYQTLFSPLEEIHTPELYLPGYGQGGFVVIRAKKDAHKDERMFF